MVNTVYINYFEKHIFNNKFYKNHSEFAEKEFYNCKFLSGQVVGLSFHNSQFFECAFDKVGFFNHSDFRGVSFNKCTFKGSLFSRTSSFDLKNINDENQTFREYKLYRVKFNDTDLSGVRFLDTSLTGTEFTSNSFKSVDFFDEKTSKKTSAIVVDGRDLKFEDALKKYRSFYTSLNKSAQTVSERSFGL